MTPKEILKQYIVELLKVLPMRNPTFLSMLEQNGLLPGDSRDRIEAEKTQADKADYFIQHVIKTSTDLYLPKLLKAMEIYCKEDTDVALGDLAADMRVEMKGMCLYNYIYMCILIYT